MPHYLGVTPHVLLLLAQRSGPGLGLGVSAWHDGVVVEIFTQRLRLRRFRAEDLAEFVAYRTTPEIARYQSWDSAFSMADAQRFLASQRDVELGGPGEWVQLAALDRRSGALCGDCAVRVLSEPPATAEIGITFAPAHQGSGLATEALAAVITELFERHSVHRVFAEADDRNDAVHRLLERLGFRCEARLVEADWFKGAWSTLRVFGLLSREWRKGTATGASTSALD